MNKNTIPFDTESPFVTSGIRIGTPAVTSRGFKEEEMKEIASIMAKVLKNHEDEAVKKEAQERVTALTDKFRSMHKYSKNEPLSIWMAAYFTFNRKGGMKTE